jgi:hypothetical protein
MARSTHPEATRIIVAIRSFDGVAHTQRCATQALARHCMRVFRSDPTVACAIAYYTDSRGVFETYSSEQA